MLKNVFAGIVTQSRIQSAKQESQEAVGFAAVGAAQHPCHDDCLTDFAALVLMLGGQSRAA